MSLAENDMISKTLLTIDKYKSFDALKTAVAENDYNPQTPYFVRSLIWKSIFITESTNIQVWGEKLQNSRRVYHELLKSENMNVPWNNLESDSEYYQPLVGNTNMGKLRVQRSILTRVSVDPLKQNSAIDDDDELLRTIILDIDRLFPGENFFNVANRRQLIEILFVWLKCNGAVGYKQGFHEIIGLIYKNIQNDSITIPNTNMISCDDYKILNLYDLNYLRHDMFTIFNKFMNNFGIIHNYYEDETILIKEIDKLNQNLMKVDQLIHYNLISKLKLESQLWCIRYFRLILLREFNDLEGVSFLWDKLITVEATKFSNLLSFIIILMLINLKSELIVCDFSESLSLLLHYPVITINNDDSSLSHKQRYEFFNNLFKYSNRLLHIKDNDLKLYELGLKLNEKYNPDLKISLSFNGTLTSFDSNNSRNNSRVSSPSRSSSPKPVSQSITKPEPSNPVQLRAEKMAFEKYRLEMRLKKKAQLLMRQ